MLSRIFKGRNRLSQPDPTARRQAVEELSAAKAESLQGELLALAGSDEDPGVRKACIARLTNPDSLAVLLDDESWADVAAQRISELLEPNSDSQLARHPLVLKLQLLAMTPADAEPVIAAIDDVELLVDLAVRARQELRTALLEKLQTTAALTELERGSRDRDKALNRLARERLEQIRATRNQAAEARTRVVELAEALERHQRLDRDDMAEQHRNILLREFDAATENFHALAQTLTAAGEQSVDISAALRQVAATRNRELAITAPVVPPTAHDDPFPELVTEFQSLKLAMQRGDDFATITTKRQQLTEQWLGAADQNQPNPDEHAEFEEVSHAYRELADCIGSVAEFSWAGSGLEPLPESFPQDPPQMRSLWRHVGEHKKALRQGTRFVEGISWPSWAKPNAAYADLLTGMERIRHEIARAEQHEQNLKSRLDELLDKLIGEIDAGSVTAALATLNHARDVSKSLAEQTADKPVKKLNQEAARLAELRDWQTYATTPKREALCEAMQALVDQPLEPSDQADRIKRLRQDWNALGTISRSDDRKLADRFNTAAEEAFKPCRAYFGEQAELRRLNLAERRKICDQLEAYLDDTDWKQADMKAAEQILRTARSEWRRYHPVDRNPGRPVEERFERLQNRLHKLIKMEWDTNLQLKQTIVEEAKATHSFTLFILE